MGRTKRRNPGKGTDHEGFQGKDKEIAEKAKIILQNNVGILLVHK